MIKYWPRLASNKRKNKQLREELINRLDIELELLENISAQYLKHGCDKIFMMMYIANLISGKMHSKQIVENTNIEPIINEIMKTIKL